VRKEGSDGRPFGQRGGGGNGGALLTRLMSLQGNTGEWKLEKGPQGNGGEGDGLFGNVLGVMGRGGFGKVLKMGGQ